MNFEQLREEHKLYEDFWDWLHSIFVVNGVNVFTLNQLCDCDFCQHHRIGTIANFTQLICDEGLVEESYIVQECSSRELLVGEYNELDKIPKRLVGWRGDFVNLCDCDVIPIFRLKRDI